MEINFENPVDFAPAAPYGTSDFLYAITVNDGAFALAPGRAVYLYISVDKI